MKTVLASYKASMGEEWIGGEANHMGNVLLSRAYVLCLSGTDLGLQGRGTVGCPRQ